MGPEDPTRTTGEATRATEEATRTTGESTASIDRALVRVAVVVRGVGAVWMAVLAVVYGATGQLAEPGVAAAVTAGGAAWALLLASRRWLGGPAARAAVVLDLATAAAALVVPAALGETAGFAGGYPFAALVVALAVGGRRGVAVAVAVLSVATVASLVLGGRVLSPFVAGQLLLYVFSAIAMVLGVDVLRASEARARRAEADLAVAEERAALAAHLHDSVLQTLALVQRRAEDPAVVRALARRQERDLRDRLFGGAPAQASTVGRALQAVADRVEAEHGVTVRLVTAGGVGDRPLPADGRSGLAAVVAAGAEAVVNAAVHAGVGAIDVYAGSEEGPGGREAVLYVRDRGCGFDLGAVPADRQGVRGSILDRVRRAGGTAEVSTAPGAGTEVRLAVRDPG